MIHNLWQIEEQEDRNWFVSQSNGNSPFVEELLNRGKGVITALGSMLDVGQDRIQVECRREYISGILLLNKTDRTGSLLDTFRYNPMEAILKHDRDSDV